MPDDIVRLTKTVRDRHSGWVYSLWDEPSLAGLGLKQDRLHDEFGTWAAASNFIRLLVLQKLGGVYLDTDFECLKPIDGLLDNAAIAAEQDGGRICNAFMGAEPNHPWINWQLANIARHDRRDAASGVYLATDAPREGLTIVPQHLIYPFLYSAKEGERVIHPDSLLIHHWHGSWNK